MMHIEYHKVEATANLDSVEGSDAFQEKKGMGLQTKGVARRRENIGC